MIEIPTDVQRRYARKNCVPDDDASTVFQRLEEFLDAAVQQVGLSPTAEVDAAWHEFILDTRAYSDYCASRYGRFVHHIPGRLPEVADGKTETCSTEECGSGVAGQAAACESCSSDCRGISA